MNRTLLKSKHSCEFSAAKKIYCLLLSVLIAQASYSANCVSVTKVSANYQTQQVTFKLTWTGCNGTTHLNKAWCFVYFQLVDAAGNGGAWQRATISGTPLVINGTYAAGNSNGFWITGANSQSATVTVKLGNASGRFNWCTFATDYPPNTVSYTNGTYTLRGTKPFIINGTTVNSKTYSAGIINTITDATGCPGWIERDVPTTSGTCKTGLVLVGGYCRDLGLDNAFVACGLEVKNNDSKGSDGCVGESWRWPTVAELQCIRTSGVAGVTGMTQIAYMSCEDANYQYSCASMYGGTQRTIVIFNYVGGTTWCNPIVNGVGAGGTVRYAMSAGDGGGSVWYRCIR